MNKSTLLSVCLLLAVLNINAQIISTFAGNGIAASTGDGGPAIAASFNNPSGTFRDASGNTYVVEYTGNKVRKIDLSGTVSTFAGNGVGTYGGDGGPASTASLHTPIDIITDHSGNAYIVDNVNQRIRKVDAAGIITTYAGNGIFGYTGDGGPATNASIGDPDRIGMDRYGNLFIADADNYVVRKVNTSGIITTVIGIGVPAYSGDGGPATAAGIRQPLGVAFDINGNMYIADGYNHVVRKVTPAGIISTFAGNGTSGISGDGGPATAASMMLPGGIAIDSACNVYVTDWSGNNVRKISISSGTIITVAGTGAAGFSGDGGPATAAMINGPDNLGFDPGMNVYIADFYNNRVREVANMGEFGICPPSTLEEETIKMKPNQFLLYPNPGSNYVEIESGLEEKFAAPLKVISSLGQLVFNESVAFEHGKYRLGLSCYAPGNYFVIITDSKGVVHSYKVEHLK